MPLIETILVSTLTTSIAKALVGVWVNDTNLLSDAKGSVLEWALVRSRERTVALAAEERFHRLGEQVALSLVPLFQRAKLTNEQQGDVVQAMKDTITRVTIEPQVLIRHDFDGRRFSRHLLTNPPTIVAHFEQTERELYEMAVVATAEAIIAVAKELPAYQGANLAELLQRTSSVDHKLTQVLATVQRLEAEVFERQVLAQAMISEIRKLRLEAQENSLTRRAGGRSFSVGYNLPRAVLFVNREDTLHELRNHLTVNTQKIIVITGRGGIGKTALAARIYEELEDSVFTLRNTQETAHGANGISVVSCRDTDRSIVERIFTSFGQLLGVPHDVELPKLFNRVDVDFRTKVLGLLSRLKNGSYLLVLDNFENALEIDGTIREPALEELIGLLASEEHSLRTILTSRENPYVKDASVPPRLHYVSLRKGLPPEDAVKLLLHLEEASGINCGLKDSDESLLYESVDLVGRVPKGIEYIYSILATKNTLSLQQLVNDTAIFKGEVLTNLTALQFSHLSKAEKKVLMALAIYNRPVPVAAVQYLLLTLSEVIDARVILETLGRNGLVATRRGHNVYDLHPQDQEYTYQQVIDESDNEIFNRKEMHERAAEFYSQLKKQASEWHDLLDIQPNLDEIAQLVMAEQFDNAATLLNEIDGEDLFLQLWGHYQLVIELRTQLVGKLSDEALVQSNYGNLGLVYIDVGRINDAIDVLQKAVESAVKGNHKEAQAQWIGVLGHAYWNLGDFEQAVTHRKEALAIAQDIDSTRFEGLNLRNLGLIHRHLGDVHQALDYYKQALMLARKSGDRRGEGTCLNNIGYLYYSLITQYNTDEFPALEGLSEEDALQVSINHFTEAMEIAIEMSDKRGEGIRASSLGEAYLQLCVYSGSDEWIELAIEFLARAYDIARDMGHIRGFCNRARMLGIAHLLQKEGAHALRYFTECIEACNQALAQSTLYEVLYYRAFSTLAVTCLTRDSGLDAEQDYVEALSVNAERGVLRQQIHELERLTKCLRNIEVEGELVANVLLLLSKALQD